MSDVVAIAAGLLIAALAQFLALMLGGAGHGWTDPFFFSFVLFVTWPLALARIPGPVGTSAYPDGIMLVLGAVTTLLLIVKTSSEPQYFWRMADQDGGVRVIIAWLILWFGWQIVTAVNLLRGRRSQQGGLEDEA